MNNIDRFIRIIYTEADISKLLTFPIDARQDAVFNWEEYVKRATSFFWLEGGDFREKRNRYWRMVIERYLRCYPKDYSEDEVGALLAGQLSLIARVPLGSSGACGDTSRVNALQFFPYIASELLSVEGDRLTVKQGSMLEWSGIANKIDQNVLFAAYDAYCGGGASKHAQLGYEDRRLNDILSRGYAENHAHLNGSGYSSDINWYCFLWLSVYRPAQCDKALRAYVNGRWNSLDDDGRDRIVLAFKKIPIMRRLLNKYACSVLPSNGPASREAKLMVEERRRLSRALAQLLWVRDEDSLTMMLGQGILANICDCDGEIAAEFPDDPTECHAFERGFLLRMFKALSGFADHPLAVYAFNAYIAGITQFKLGMLHDNLLMGFSRFSAAEAQKEAFLDYVPDGKRLLYRSVFDRYYRIGGVRFIELRIAPKTRAQFTRLVDQLDDANNWAFALAQRTGCSHKITYRLTTHFIKDKEPIEKGDGVARKERLADLARRQLAHIEALFDLSEECRSYVSKFAAIDTANFELCTRPETYAVIFRKFDKEVSLSYETGKTYHVGEDFMTLCNGLRAVDEVLEFLEFSKGDRLGHATALGLKAQDYYQGKRFYIVCALEEHVDDLAWLHQILAQYYPGETDVLVYLEKEYLKYMARICGAEAVPPLSLYQKAYRLRGNNPELYLAPHATNSSCLNSVADVSWKREAVLAHNDRAARKLYSRCHFDGRLKRAGASPLIVKAEKPYIKAVEYAQCAVREKARTRGVGIESNPTSNRKISHVSRFIDLPLFQFNNRGLEEVSAGENLDSHDIPVTINSDDCGVFQTDLAMEYALVVEALKRENSNHEDKIYDYINHLRELSLSQSFRCREADGCFSARSYECSL